MKTSDSTYKKVRGGSWRYGPGYCRSTSRNSWYEPSYRYINLGFRILEELNNDKKIPRSDSWGNYQAYARTGNRYNGHPLLRYNRGGFRILEMTRNG